mmetsp:Transcript_117352/g.336652  ORF Transcript_117352/g.336652 Transcript_117352/m.336652 type:complete len:277 (+) Transcript_117352:842-1672(+)
MALPLQGEVAQVTALDGHLQQQRRVSVRGGHERRGGGNVAGFAAGARLARAGVGECLGDRGAVGHVSAEDDGDHQAPQLAAGPSRERSQEVAFGAPQHLKSRRDMVVLVHVDVVVAHGALVGGTHEELVGDALVLEVMHRSSQQASQLNKRHSLDTAQVLPLKSPGDQRGKIGMLQQRMHDVEHGGSMGAIVVGVRVVVAPLDFLQEATELVAVHAKVLDEAGPGQQVVPECAQGLVVRAPRECQGVEVPRLIHCGESGRAALGQSLEAVDGSAPP